MSKSATFWAGVAMSVTVATVAATVYNVFSPGGALSGTWNSQNVNLAAGSSFILNQLPVVSGGTGDATLTTHGVLLGEGTSPVSAVPAMASDTLLQGQGALLDPAAVSVPNCGDSTHALSYATLTHVFGCQAISLTISTQNSVQGNGSVGTPVQLVGDAASPGNSQYYGTDGAGSKGYHALPASSGALVKISETILGAPTATVTFSSIPGTYRNLLLTITAAAAVNTAPALQMQFNGDTGANYTAILGYQQQSGSSGVAASAGATALSYNSPISTNATANEGSTLNIIFHDYARTTFNKNISGTFTRFDSTTGFFTGTIAGFWISTAAINSVSIFLAGGANFVTGSVFTLYGES